MQPCDAALVEGRPGETTTNLKLPSVRKLHIFRWLLPFCKNWEASLEYENFDEYMPKLESLEMRNLKRLKIEPVSNAMVCKVHEEESGMSDKLQEVLCDVFKKVLYVMRVRPQMYDILETVFVEESYNEILGVVRVCAPDEDMFQAQVSVVFKTQLFMWHLHTSLEPLARDHAFRKVTFDVKSDAMKTTAGLKTLTNLFKIVHARDLLRKYVTNVIDLLAADCAYHFAYRVGFMQEGVDSSGVNICDFTGEVEAAVQTARTEKELILAKVQDVKATVVSAKINVSASRILWIKKARELCKLD